MDLPSFTNPADIEAIGLLFTLLPGLLAYLVFRVLAYKSEKVEATDAVLSGLAYTLIVHAIWYVLKSAGSVFPTPDLVGLPLTAVGLGLVLARLYTAGRFFSLLRRLKLTSLPSWSTVWETSFRDFRGGGMGEYVVLHLKDKRRVMGAIRGFSRCQEKGHICLQRVHWLDIKSNERLEEHPGLHLFNADDVAVVEFLPTCSNGGETSVRQASDSEASTATATPKVS